MTARDPRQSQAPAECIRSPYASVYGLLVALGMADCVLLPLREARPVEAQRINATAGVDVPQAQATGGDQ